MSFDPKPPTPTHPDRPRAIPHNILELGPYQTAMTHPPLAEIRRYWDELRAGRLMPLRAEVDPRDMSSFLECCFILDRKTAGDVRFRVAGMALNDLMGMELRGMHLRSVIEPNARAQFSASLETMFDTPEIQEYQLRSAPSHAPALTARLLILPLRDDKGDVTRAMGCLATQGIVGIPPRRFTVDQVACTSLLTGARVNHEPSVNHEPRGDHAPKAPALAGFAERAAPFEPGPFPKKTGPTGTDTPTGVPYLRIVK